MEDQPSQRNASDYLCVERAIHYLEANFRRQPTLDDMAASVHLSKFHFERLFKRWAGITPTQFLRYLTLEYAKARLSESRNLLDAAYEAGLSGPGRLHDLFVTFEAVTPGEYKQEGAGLEITYGFHDSPFGTMLLAMTVRGICALFFGGPTTVDDLARLWPQSRLVQNPGATQPVVDRIFVPTQGSRPFHLLLKGTNFQVNVWRGLLAIPSGAMVSYGDVAGYVGHPNATRAVASAIARNPVAFLVPCHRVIRSTGDPHQYRWGSTRKRAMLAWEAARSPV
jgi:AraC family transcriptional regulator of adaptative response/methylated-DNA-[protein]-cysteine methyltransferase